MKIILPSQPRRIWLISFWLALSVSLALLMGILLWALTSPQWSIVGILMGLGAVLFGVLQPELVPLGYGVWNRIARYYARRARVLLMAICYFVIFVAVCLARARILIASPINGKSMWVPRRTMAPAAYGSQYDCETNEAPMENWISAFLSWAKRSGNLWACCLLPILVLLSYLETGGETSVPGSIYTLY